jgi:hypothetical protein
VTKEVPPVLATAPTRTLDQFLAEILDAAHGAAITCLVCGEHATAVQRATGPVSYACRSCGSVLEDEPEFETGPFPLDTAA